MASFFYNPGLAMAMGYNSDASFPNSCWAKTNVYKVMLLKSTYVPNKDHEYVSSVSSHEVATAATYTGGYGGSGRKTLYNSDIYYDNTNDQVVMLGDLDGVSDERAKGKFAHDVVSLVNRVTGRLKGCRPGHTAGGRSASLRP